MLFETLYDKAFCLTVSLQLLPDLLVLSYYGVSRVAQQLWRWNFSGTIFS